MNWNPYGNVNWQTCERIKSSSHLHAQPQDRHDLVYAHGYRHIMNTLYLPAHPVYPLENHVDVQSDVWSSPGSEKVRFSNSAGHYAAMGSFHASDGRHTEEGAEMSWEDKMQGVFDNLQFADGGGVVWAHPENSITSSAMENVKRFLDFDARCLGLEIYNNGHRYRPAHDRYPWVYQELWDYALSTGRRCYGFAAVDWAVDDGLPFWGANWLLVGESTEHEILKAYREGRFYCTIRDTGLRLERFVYENDALTVEFNKSCLIKFITERGEVYRHEGTTARYENDNHTYIRAEGQDLNPPWDMFHDEREPFQKPVYNTLYTQPVMLKSLEQLQLEC